MPKKITEVHIMNNNIRQASIDDALRIAEIEIFNYRLNFYPLFGDDAYYFGELQVSTEAEKFRSNLKAVSNTYVYDDGAVKGFVRLNGNEIEKLFVEPVLQGQAIGAKLLEYAVRNKGASFLWALEKNVRAIKFYEKRGFHLTEDRKYEEGTTEYLVRLEL